MNSLSRAVLIEAVYGRAKSRSAGMYGYDDTGGTYPIRAATRTSSRYAEGIPKVPATCKAVCSEGDEAWTPLPGWITVRQKLDALAAAARVRAKGRKPHSNH